MKFQNTIRGLACCLLITCGISSLECAAFAAEPAVGTKVYDFENLMLGKLAGQDNWKQVEGLAVSGPGKITIGTGNEVTPPDGPNMTKVLQSPAGVTRINNAAWGYTVKPSDTAWQLQLDYKREGPYVSLGYDDNGDGTIDSKEYVGWIVFGAGMAMQAADNPPGHRAYTYSDPYPNLKGNFEGNAATWLRMNLTFDWTDKAPGRYGTMLARVKNLQTGSDWETVRWPGGVTKLPPTIFAGPKLRDGVRTSKNGSRLA